MIIIGSDHAGFDLKEQIKSYLIEQNYNIVDVGPFTVDPEDDFSSYVSLMAKANDKNKNTRIIAVCGSGVGMCIGLNKQKNIFCVLGHNVEEVKLARGHNNVNALALAGRKISIEQAKEMINAFLTTEHLGGKYAKRMASLEDN